MADRRVEARGSIIGTGMATEPDKIRQLEDENARKQRAWREAPEKGFGDVLKDAPAKAELADDDDAPDPRRKKKAPEAPAAEAAMAADALAAPADAPVKGGEAPKLPRVPVDPREAMLRRRLAQSQLAPRPAPPSDTPPTGSRTRKPS